MDFPDSNGGPECELASDPLVSLRCAVAEGSVTSVLRRNGPTLERGYWLATVSSGAWTGLRRRGSRGSRGAPAGTMAVVTVGGSYQLDFSRVAGGLESSSLGAA